MTGVSLFPRLNPHGVATILHDSGATGPQLSRSANFIAEYGSLISFAPSGGTRAAADIIVGIAKRLRSIAADCGFPSSDDADARGRFDRLAARALATIPELRSGESLRDDVWAFIATVLAPDLTAWRFPDPARERFGGGVRNIFQRLWMRGRILDRGEEEPERWKLVESHSEDAMVQIFERPSIAGNERLARAIAEAWTDTAEKVGRSQMEDLMRRATRLIRLRNEIVDLSFLPEGDLVAEVESAFRMAAEL
jgi:hypothetical protein